MARRRAEQGRTAAGRRVFSGIACVALGLGSLGTLATLTASRSAAAPASTRQGANVAVAPRAGEAALGPTPETSGCALDARIVPQPTIPAAQVTAPFTALDKITCPSNGDCLAVGEIQWPSRGLQPAAVEELDGAWSTTVLPWPPDGDTDLQLTRVSAPSCSSPGNCAVAMSLTDDTNPDSPTSEAGILLESSGVWSDFELPAQYGAGVASLGCPADGVCFFTVDGVAGVFELNGSALSTVTMDLPPGTSIASIGPLSCTTFRLVHRHRNTCEL